MRRLRWLSALLATLVIGLGVGCGTAGPTAPAAAQNAAVRSTAAEASVAAEASPSPAGLTRQVRITVPTKSITFLPFYFGQDQGLYRQEGLELELVQMRPPLGISALEAGDVDYSAAPGVGMRAAIQGAAIRAVMFVQDRPSFTLIGQPGVPPDQIKTVAVSGLGSTAHYAALNVMRKLGRGGPEDATYFATNDTAKSYQALQGKTAEAAILSPPYTTMATLAGFTHLGDAFDMVDVQGGLVTTTRHLAEQPAEVQALLRGTLRALQYIAAHKDETVAYMDREFELEPGVAAGSYAIVMQVLDMAGDMEDAALRSVVDQMKQDAEITDDVPLDRVADLRLLRQVQTELGISR